MDSGIDVALRKRREHLGIDRREAARRLEVDPTTVWYWEAGRFSPSDEKLDRVAEFLDWTPLRVLKALHAARKARRRAA